MLALFRRPQPQETNVTEQTTDTAVMRFLTLGGATVELHDITWEEERLRADGYEKETVEGRSWRCTGCDVDSASPGQSQNIYGRYYGRDNRSRDHANTHAEKCRAMPRPTA